jgi:predicted house-cleaning noncanonical NTP pyrophosphatase (MazG superfamily)
MSVASNQISGKSLPSSDGKGHQPNPHVPLGPQPQGNKLVFAEKVAEDLANNEHFIRKILTSSQFKSELAKGLSEEVFIRQILTSSQFESELAKDLSEEVFIKQMLTSHQFESELAKRLNAEKWRWVRLGFTLAIVSFLIMGGAYWLSLLTGGTDATKIFALGDFCLVILVVNVVFGIVLFRAIKSTSSSLGNVY